MSTVLFDARGAMHFDNGTKRCWVGVHDAAAVLASYYVESGRQKFDVRHPYIPMVIEPGLSDDVLCSLFGYWCSDITFEFEKAGI